MKINRETWLENAVEELRPYFAEKGNKLPEKVFVSCSWPTRRAVSPKRRVLGQCHTTDDKKKARQITISPVEDNPFEVLSTLTHELCHAALPHGTGHKKPFAQLAKRVGLEGKPTECGAVKESPLGEFLTSVVEKLGEYPHEKIDPSGIAKQPTRLLKVFCPDCGCVIRITAKWLDEVGTPMCGCGTKMVEDNGEEVVALKALESHVEYATHLERFTIRFKKSLRNQSWTLIDWDENRMTPHDTRQDALDFISALEVGLASYDKIELADDANEDAGDMGEIGFPEGEFNIFTGEVRGNNEVRDIVYMGDDEVEDDFFSAQDEKAYIEHCEMAGREYEPVTDELYQREAASRGGEGEY